MPKILLGISALFAIIATVFGFMSGGKITELKSEAAVARDQLGSAKQETKKAEQAEKQAVDALAPAKLEAEQAQSELASTKASLEKAQKEASESKGQLDTINSQFASIKEALKSQGIENVDNIGQMMTDLNTKLKEQETKLAESETKMKESEQLVATLTQRTKDAEAQTAELSAYKTSREQKLMAKGLEGQVLAVNQAWNFVVISIGDGAGVVANAEMIVVRGGEAIAKVKVTSVEKSTSVADIVPGSTAQGVQVQPGDRVIYQVSQGS